MVLRRAGQLGRTQRAGPRVFGGVPHIILETTADLVENAYVPDILDALVRCLAGFETIKGKAIKAYHTLRPVWHMGPGAPAGFAHCTVCVLRGRPPELLKNIAEGLYGQMKERFKESGKDASLTLEVREMDPATYRK